MILGYLRRYGDRCRKTAMGWNGWQYSGAFSVTLTLTEARAVECVSAGLVHTHPLMMLNRHHRSLKQALFRFRFNGLSCIAHLSVF